MSIVGGPQNTALYSFTASGCANSRVSSLSAKIHLISPRPEHCVPPALRQSAVRVVAASPARSSTKVDLTPSSFVPYRRKASEEE